MEPGSHNAGDSKKSAEEIRRQSALEALAAIGFSSLDAYDGVECGEGLHWAAPADRSVDYTYEFPGLLSVLSNEISIACIIADMRGAHRNEWFNCVGMRQLLGLVRLEATEKIRQFIIPKLIGKSIRVRGAGVLGMAWNDKATFNVARYHGIVHVEHAIVPGHYLRNERRGPWLALSVTSEKERHGETLESLLVDDSFQQIIYCYADTEIFFGK